MTTVNAPAPLKPLAPEAYARVFENFPEGKLVLEELVRRFARGPIFEGGIDGIRKSDYRAGARSVPEFILRQINQASGLNEPDEPEV